MSRRQSVPAYRLRKKSGHAIVTCPMGSAAAKISTFQNLWQSCALRMVGVSIMNPTRRRHWLAVVLAVLVGSMMARAGEPEWKVGFAQSKITPHQPLPMAGYGGR